MSNRRAKQDKVGGGQISYLAAYIYVLRLYLCDQLKKTKWKRGMDDVWFLFVCFCL